MSVYERFQKRAGQCRVGLLHFGALNVCCCHDRNSQGIKKLEASSDSEATRPRRVPKKGMRIPTKTSKHMTAMRMLMEMSRCFHVSSAQTVSSIEIDVAFSAARFRLVTGRGSLGVPLLPATSMSLPLCWRLVRIMSHSLAVYGRGTPAHSSSCSMSGVFTTTKPAMKCYHAVLGVGEEGERG